MFNELKKNGLEQKKVIASNFSWSIIILIILILYYNSVSQEFILKVLCCISAIYFIITMIYWRKLFGSIFRIYYIFLGLTFLFMQGQVILHGLGLTNQSILSYKFSIEIINKTIIYIHIAIICFQYGAIYFLASKKNEKKISKERFIEEKSCRILGVALIIISFVPEVYVIYTKYKISKLYGYAALYQSIAVDGISSGVKIISYFFVPACIYLIVGCKKNELFYKIGLLGVIGHIIGNLAMGYRANAILPAISILWIIFNKDSNLNIDLKSVKKLKYVMIFIVLGCIFVFPFIREYRNVSKESLSQIISIKDKEEKNLDDYTKTIYDMGKSMQTLSYTLHMIPNEEKYYYGKSYFIAISTAFPNLFWDVHPAQKHGNLSTEIVKRYDREFYDFGGGFGYSFIAEFYANFGLLGIIVCSTILGYIIIRIEELIIVEKSLGKYSAFATFSMYLMFYPREEFEYLVRPLLWYSILPYILYNIVKYRISKDVTYKKI